MSAAALGRNPIRKPASKSHLRPHIFSTPPTSGAGIISAALPPSTAMPPHGLGYRARRIYPLTFGLAAINLLLGRQLSPPSAESGSIEAAKTGIADPRNLEEKGLVPDRPPAVRGVRQGIHGKTLGMLATDLPGSIITRLPVRFTTTSATTTTAGRGFR